MASPDKPTCNNGIITTPDSNYIPNPEGIGYEIFTHLKKHFEKKLVIDGHTGKEETFGSALEKSVRLAMKMQEHGIQPNDLILICTLNTVDSCIPIFASLYIGAKVTFFDHQIPLREATLMINEINPVMMFISLESVHFIEKLMKESNKRATIVVFGETDSYLNYFDMICSYDGEDQFLPIKIEETQVAFIFFSSGSTAVPKPICFSHVALLTLVGAPLDLNESFNMMLIFSHLYWITNFCYWVYSIIKGYCRLSMNFTEDLQLVWNVIDTYKPNFVFLKPNQMRQLCEAMPPDANGDSVKKVYVGGGHVSANEWKNYKKIFRNAVLSSGYGLSEVGLLFYFPSSTEEELQCIESKPTSIGRVLNGISYKLIEDVLMSRNEINTACVFGVPCGYEAEHAVAIVVLSSTCTSIYNIKHELCQYVEESLGSRYKLGDIKIVEEIPLLPGGKPDIRKLKKDYIVSTKEQCNE
ncbi:hypothetical protein FQR65_LT02698 [Abscondita terminalis]|nr:hypothetical protein FQR65_LT02698 [Abscondita terminalis]